jgi:hypothetical protein
MNHTGSLHRKRARLRLRTVVPLLRLTGCGCWDVGWCDTLCRSGRAGGGYALGRAEALEWTDPPERDDEPERLWLPW